MFGFLIVGMFCDSIDELYNGVGERHVIKRCSKLSESNFNDAKKMLSDGIILPKGNHKFCKIYFLNYGAKKDYKKEELFQHSDDMQKFVSYFEYIVGTPPYYFDGGWAELS